MFSRILLLLVYHRVTASLLTISPESDEWIRYGRDLSVTCTFSSKHQEKIQLFHDDNVIQVSDQVTTTLETFTEADEKQTTVFKYLKTDVNFDDSGTYECRADNKKKNVKIQVVKGRLKIFPKTERVIAFQGERVTLTCEYQGSHRLDVRWSSSSGRDLKQSGFVIGSIVKSGDHILTKVDISKTSASFSDSGEYSCTAGPFSKTVTLEVYQGECSNNLVTGPHGVADSHLTASSFYEDSVYVDGPDRARLNLEDEKVQRENGNFVILGGGWMADEKSKSQWIQVEFKAQSVVRSILTQGRFEERCCNQSDWVTEFKVHFSQDGIVWLKYKDQSGNDLYFRANDDANTIVENDLPSPIITKYIRIYPTAWHNKIALRLEIKGCLIPQNLRIKNPVQGVINLPVPMALKISCEYTGPKKDILFWSKNFVRMETVSGFRRTSVEQLSGGRVTITDTIIKQKTEYLDSGNYTCFVPNSTFSATVTVHAMKLDKNPKIERYWVSSQNAVQLSCEYRSINQRDFTWEYSGVNINNRQFQISRDIKKSEGAIFVTSSIHKPYAEATDSGNYTCRIGEMSRSWEVNVLSVNGNGSWQAITPNKTMYLECDVKGLPKDALYQMFWTKEGVPLKEVDANGRMNYFPNSRTLQIIRTQPSDAGKYECNILLEVGTPAQQQVSITKEIYAPPRTMIDGMKTINVGDSLHMYCKTSGYPPPSIVWKKNHKSLSELSSRVTFLPYGGLENGHLVVFDVSGSEAGEYTCEAKSDYFKSAESRLQVEVKEVSLATSPPLLIAIIVGSVVVCLAIICCGMYVKCNQRAKKKNYAYDTDSLERLRQSRPRLPRNNTFEEDQPKLIKLIEENHFYSKRPPMSSPPPSVASQRSVGTFESVSYEREPFRPKLATPDPTLSDEEEGYNTGSTREKVRFSFEDIK
ncbi:hemicentin-1-like [Saccostrea echinata]|uniref:hemicentin-1-like n=1 Tax=Saccostrea echinata TaxID=191078 RepID=UPI002A804DE1|nr:hemicentin-1-like [Saccostrea echinata]